MIYSLLDNVIINSILIFFPLAVYLLIIKINDNISQNNKTKMLTPFLITSLFLIIKLGVIRDNYIIILCNIPILIAYINNKIKLGITLSIFNIVYFSIILNGNIFFLVFKYTFFLIFYIYIIRKNISKKKYIYIITIFQSFIIFFEYYLYLKNVNIENFIYLFTIALMYYFISIFILYSFNSIQKIEKMKYDIDELYKDKKIKESLFELTHEIKNPLSVCKGYLDMINFDNGMKNIKYVNIMKQEIERSINIMNDFSEYNKITLEKEEIELNVLLDDIYDTYKLLTGDKIKLKYYENKNDIYIYGDYNRLKQVFINIIKNSIEAIDSNGIIILKSYKKNNKIEISIKDNGKGMDKNTLDNIMNIFYTTKQNGTGIGVSLSNEIIKEHNGELLYKSKINEGTETIIRLPAM